MTNNENIQAAQDEINEILKRLCEDTKVARMDIFNFTGARLDKPDIRIKLEPEKQRRMSR